MNCPVCKTDNILIEHFKDPNKDKDIESYMCIKCGYMSNSDYVVGSSVMNEMLAGNKYSQILLELHIYDEDSGLYWFPIVLLKNDGAVFPEGNHETFKWAYIPIIDISDEEKDEYGEEYTRRFAVELKETFEKYDFLNACKKLGVIDPSLKVK